MEFQRHVLEVASGASPHCYDALKLAFGNTIDVIEQEQEQERQRIEAEREAREEAERQEEAKNLMLRPTVMCPKGRVGHTNASFRDVAYGSGCSICNRALVCSGCGNGWRGSSFCDACDMAFR